MLSDNLCPNTLYLPSRRAAVFNFPDITLSTFSEVKRRLDFFLASVKKYKVQHVLLDFTATQVRVGEEIFSLVLDYLLFGFNNCDVKRLARLPFTQSGWEARATAVFSKASVIFPRSVQTAFFVAKTDALSWLWPVETEAVMQPSLILLGK